MKYPLSEQTQFYKYAVLLKRKDVLFLQAADTATAWLLTKIYNISLNVEFLLKLDPFKYYYH